MKLIQEIFASRQLFDPKSTGKQLVADAVALILFTIAIYFIVAAITQPEVVV